MGWRTLVVSRHAKISTMSHNLLVQTEIETSTVPIVDIDVLILESTQIVISATAVMLLAEQGIPIVFTGRNGQPVAETINTSCNRRTPELIRAQLSWRPSEVETLWTKIVDAKIRNQAQTLRNRGIDDTSIIALADELELGDPTNREAVAAHKYFPQLFGTGFSRGEPSPINAALNYGYSILLAIVNREIVATGHLTAIGIHHDSQDNDYNLGSDLMEPFRPLVDVWVANLHFKEFTPDVKHSLADLFNMSITFNGGTNLFRTAITSHVRSCLHYLDGEGKLADIKVVIPDEVSGNAINDHV